MSYQTIYDLLRVHAGERPHETAALARRHGSYAPLTWSALDDRVQRLARGLVALGLEPGERVCLIAETSIDWVVADLAVVAAGGVTVPVYTAEVPDAVQWIAADSGASYVIAEDPIQVAKLKRERARLGAVRQVVQLRGAHDPGDAWVLAAEDVERRGAGKAAELEARTAAVGRDDLATIIYTAGTTGRPKGVVLTHASLLYEAEAVTDVGLLVPDELQLIYLPLAHSLGKVLVIAWLATGHVLAFAESPATVMRDVLEVKPTFMAAVPRFFERMYATIVRRAVEAGAITHRLFAEATALSAKRGEAEARSRRLGALEAVRFAALRRLVLDRVANGVEQALGGRMRLMISGGAPLSPKIAWLLRDAGLMVLEGWGLAETSAATTVNRPDRWRIGSVGLPMPGTRLRIADDGEILVQGGGVMREYWGSPEATREVLGDGGWLRTGDIGFLDDDGFLHITDRKKDIIVTAGGKNVAPQKLENLLQSHPLVSHAVVHGDRRKYLSALVTLDAQALRALAAERGLGNGSYAELSQRQEVRKELERIIDGLNEQLPAFEAIRRFKILEHDFTIEAGELAPSLKVKRRVIYQRYKTIFDAFYDELYG